ncbi:MAG: zf-TFIIB domain-containing protein [Leptolyngbya sp. SIO4C1]|nr:zf-TFIIB domain-containing protein [Leptolyngbya sp. SIO4C1]
MRCPKDLNVMLETGQLTAGLAAECCPTCQGAWIDSETYQAWQTAQLDTELRLGV